MHREACRGFAERLTVEKESEFSAFLGNAISGACVAADLTAGLTSTLKVCLKSLALATAANLIHMP